MPEIHIATLIIILANVAFSMKGFNDFSFFEKYKFNIAGVRRGEQWRMFTSGFLHADFNHLIFNMLTLYFFAGLAIEAVGVTRFVIIYMASLLGGSLLSLYFHKDEYHYSAIGASGAVTGILYTAIMFYPLQKFYLYFAIPIPAWILGLGYLLYSIYGMKNKVGNIGHDAHFGGAIVGYLLSILFDLSLLESSLWVVLLLAAPIILLLVLYKLGKL